MAKKLLPGQPELFYYNVCMQPPMLEGNQEVLST